MLLAYVMEDLNGMLVLFSRRGAATRPQGHTWWTSHVLHHCALESPIDGPSRAEGKADPRPWVPWVVQPVWALTQDPHLYPHPLPPQAFT